MMLTSPNSQSIVFRILFILIFDKGIKNDVKSIEIDSFIDGFRKTYPQYMTLSLVKKESLEKHIKQKFESKDSVSNKPQTRRRNHNYS